MPIPAPVPSEKKPFMAHPPKPALKPTTPMHGIRSGVSAPQKSPLIPKRPLMTGKPVLTNRPLKRLELPSERPDIVADTTPTEIPSQLSPAVIKSLNVPVIFPKSLEPQILPKADRNVTRMIPIGGLRTVGANMTMFEHGDDILIVDGGLEFARGGKSPGFNYLLPDIRFLQPYLKRIKAMFVTHGHLDQARHTDRRGDQRFAGRGSARFQCAAHRAGRRARPVGARLPPRQQVSRGPRHRPARSHRSRRAGTSCTGIHLILETYLQKISPISVRSCFSD